MVFIHVDAAAAIDEVAGMSNATARSTATSGDVTVTLIADFHPVTASSNNAVPKTPTPEVLQVLLAHSTAHGEQHLKALIFQDASPNRANSWLATVVEMDVKSFTQVAYVVCDTYAVDVPTGQWDRVEHERDLKVALRNVLGLPSTIWPS